MTASRTGACVCCSTAGVEANCRSTSTANASPNATALTPQTTFTTSKTGRLGDGAGHHTRGSNPFHAGLETAMVTAPSSGRNTSAGHEHPVGDAPQPAG